MEGRGNSSESSIKWFSEINKNTKDVGLRVNYLAEAYNHETLSKRVKIPAGFVVTKFGVKEILKEIIPGIKDLYDKINKENENEIFNFSEKVKVKIMNVDFPEKISSEILEAYETLGLKDVKSDSGYVKDILSTASEPDFIAIRPSIIGDSYFNIKGNSNVIHYIKKSLASIFEYEIILDEIKKGTNFDDLISPVIIQKMIESDKSGHVESKDKFLVSSIWGFGSGLKIKEIQKDEFVVRRDSKVIDKKINEKKYAVTRDSSGVLKIIQLKENYSFAQTLNESELQELTDIALRFENIFNEKLDFDFAIQNDEIFIVTILPSKKFELIEEESDVSEITENLREVEILPIEKITKTKLSLMISSKKDAENGKLTRIKNAGVVEIESLIKSYGVHPESFIKDFNTKEYEEIVYRELEKVSKDFDELWIKLSDFSGEEFKNLKGNPCFEEKNPLMGLVGIRYLLYQPEILKRELKAISRIENKKIGVLIPKISSVYELKKVKELSENLKIGLVLETPASMQLIKDFLLEGIDKIVFSGDNLAEYLLAIDRDNKYVKQFYDNTNPALMYQLEYVIRVARRQNVETTFLGEALNKKEMIEFLVKKEIDSIVVKPEEVNSVSKNVSKVEEEIIKGTDKEIREYELNKEKERQKKEIKEFEKIKEKELNSDISKIKMTVPTEEVNEAIELIEKEKQEYLDENSIENLSLENQEENEELVEEEIIGDFEEIKEHPLEEFDDEIEEFEDVREAVDLIEKEKQEYLENEGKLEKY